MDSVEQTIRMNNLSRDLKKYGFAESSQEAIAQAGAIYGASSADELNAEVELVQVTKAQMNEILNKMQRLWVFKEITQQQNNTIIDQMEKVTDKLNSLIKNINIIEMNQAMFEKKLHTLKENMHEQFRENNSSKPRQNTRHVEESSSREKEVQQKLEKPIDRNGVAPADVSIENIFYSGSGRR